MLKCPWSDYDSDIILTLLAHQTFSKVDNTNKKSQKDRFVQCLDRTLTAISCVHSLNSTVMTQQST